MPAHGDTDAAADVDQRGAGPGDVLARPVADEIVLLLEGAATIYFLADDGSTPSAPLGPGDVVIVPHGTWHRFDAPDRIKLLSVTPEPTDHRAERP